LGSFRHVIGQAVAKLGSFRHAPGRALAVKLGSFRHAPGLWRNWVRSVTGLDELPAGKNAGVATTAQEVLPGLFLCSRLGSVVMVGSGRIMVFPVGLVGVVARESGA
jgi:hypothetical protein